MEIEKEIDNLFGNFKKDDDLKVLAGINKCKEISNAISKKINEISKNN